MSQASERRRFPVPMRSLHAGGDLARPDHGDQCVERPLTCSEHSSKSRFNVSELAMQISSSRRDSLASTSNVGASVKFP